ncbi:MAG TPA: alanine--tRNA ligase-related protein [Ktedonobacterales bacterium]
MTTSTHHPANGPDPSSLRLWSSVEIVREYLEFFQARGHTLVPGSPLTVPNSSTSFIVAGMQQFLPYFRGHEPPPAPRITDNQRCLRTPDVDEVGTNGRKLTSFHMLGNWSIGDYGKREAITLARELLERFGLDLSRLYVTTFAANEALGIPPDDESAAQWEVVSIPRERIVPLGSEDNLWTLGGPGPCGPDTEIFVDRGVELGCGKPDCRPGCACERFLEIWNLVFIEYELTGDGSVQRLPIRSVDTGLGLERVAAVLQGVPTVFEIDLFTPARQRLAELTPLQNPFPQRERGNVGSENSGVLARVRAQRIILDHTRATLFAMLEGVTAGREGRESVVRRLIRRAARQGLVLGIEGPFLGELVGPLVEGHAGLLTDGELARVGAIARALTEEEQRFARVLRAGLKALERMRGDDGGRVAGSELFRLEAERGFPADLAAEVLAERGLTVDWASYEEAVEQHRQISRASARRRFGGA